MIRRLTSFILLFLLLFSMANPLVANKFVFRILAGKVWEGRKWVASTLAGYGIGKGIDYVLGQSIMNQIESEMSQLVEKLIAATGQERALLKEQLDLARDQHQLMSRLLEAELNGVAKIRADQERLNQRLDSFEARLVALENQVESLNNDVSRLDERVTLLEESLHSECLDLRSAPLVGAEGFRVSQTAQSQLQDHFNGQQFSLWLQINLNSCTAEMTQRGMLIQLALFTRKLNQEMSLYATFKHLGVDIRDFRSPNLNHLQRLRFPLRQTAYELDGQVQEFFLPYSEVPFQTDGRLALALVVAHDGQPIYSLSDRVISCLFGPRINCRWGN